MLQILEPGFPDGFSSSIENWSIFIVISNVNIYILNSLQQFSAHGAKMEHNQLTKSSNEVKMFALVTI